MSGRPRATSLLRTARQRTGRTIESVALEIHVSPAAFRQWETGSQKVPPERLWQLATVYRLTAEQRDALYAEHKVLAPDLQCELFAHASRWRELVAMLKRAA